VSESARSSVSAADWLPIHERLVEGVVHSLSNRVAALMGVTQLLEMRLASLDEGARTLAGESAQLREQVNLLRSIVPRQAERREPVRAGDVVRGAMALLAQDREARIHTYEMTAESPETPPLLLWRTDHVRLGVLLLLAASDTASQPTTVRVRAESGVQGTLRIIAKTPLPAAAVAGSATYAILARFAAAEGGHANSAAAPDGTTALELSLPDLGGGSARGEP
jgi:hypothetical protein